MPLSETASTAHHPIERARWSQLKTQPLLLFIIITLLLVSAGLRLAVFDRFLPYQDYTDEVNYFGLAQDMRGIADHSTIREIYGQLPPLYIYFNVAVQTIYDAVKPHPWNLPSEYYYLLRLIAVGFGIATTALLIVVGKQVNGIWSGVIAGALWGLSPLIVEFNSLAIPDPLVYLLIAIALATALHAWKTESPRWLLVSLIAGIMTIYTKYWPITAVVPSVIVGLDLLRRNPGRMWGWTVLYAVIAGVTGVYFLFGLRPTESLALYRGYYAANTGLYNAFSPERLINNLQHGILPLTMPMFVSVIIVGAAAYVYHRRRGIQSLWGRGFALVLFFAILTLPLTATVSMVTIADGRLRHVLPLTVALFPLWSALLIEIVRVAMLLLENVVSAPAARRMPVYATTLFLFLALAPQMIRGNVATIDHFQQRHVIDVVWHWTDINVPNDGIVLMHNDSDLSVMWNRPWGGYDGNRTFLWTHESAEGLLMHPPSDFAERGIGYLMFSAFDRDLRLDIPGMDAFIDQLTLVKVLPTPNDTHITGGQVYFYRMLPPQVTTDVLFGDQIMLAGYDLSTNSLNAGETFTIRPYWHITQPITRDYSLFIHVYPADRIELMTQHDSPPTVIERPTPTWDDVNELYIGSGINITLPADLPPGAYRLAIGLYEYGTNDRLHLSDGTDFYAIPLHVEG